MTNTRNYSTIFLGILTVIAIGAVFKIASSVIMPMVLALLFSFMLYPIIMKMKGVKIPEFLAIIIILLLLAGAFYLIVMLLYKSITTFAIHLPWYTEQLKGIYIDFTHQVIANISISSADFLLEYDWGRVVRSYLLTFSNLITNFGIYSFVIFLYLMFLLMEYHIFKIKLTKASPKSKKRVIIIISRITKDVSKYLVVKGFISAATGISIWIVLLIIGLDFSMLWGIMAFFLNFIPYIGSIIVVICIVLQSIVQFYPSLGMVLLVACSMTAIQVVLGSILDPKLQGSRLNLSTVIIIFFLFLWSWLWGFVGTLLAVPIAVAVKTICLSIPFLKPIGIMMGAGFGIKKKISYSGDKIHE